jgi:transcriptional regulator with XRE-family HTH domain
LRIFQGNLVVRNHYFSYNDAIQNKERKAKTMKFSEKIIQARKAKALTQEDLAEAVGVSRQAVSKWETEEAKPDLDKLVAICNALDLSMDYLCLDKQPEVTVELPPQPAKTNHIRPLILGVCIGLVVSILVGLLAMGFSREPGQPQTTEPTQLQTTTIPAEPDYSDLLFEMKTADARLDNTGWHAFKVTFVPSIYVPGMRVQIALQDQQTGHTQYLDAYKDGSAYVASISTPTATFDIDIIAVCTVGEISVQFALFNIVSDDDNGNHSNTEVLWKTK